MIDQLNEFFKSPLGVIVLAVLTAFGATIADRIRNRAKVQNQIDETVAASEKKTKELAQERERQSLELIDAIRKDWEQSQQDIAELRRKYDQVVERNIQLVSEQRASLETINKLTDQLDVCNRDADKLHADFQAMLDRLDAVQTERNAAQTALTKRNGEYEELDAALKKRNGEFEKLSADFETQKKEVERLQRDLRETKKELDETKERVKALESKPDTGQLPPLPPDADLPDTPGDAPKQEDTP